MGGVGEAGVASVEDASVGDEQDKNGSWLSFHTN
jgi:hypothetical protein